MNKILFLLLGTLLIWGIVILSRDREPVSEETLTTQDTPEIVAREKSSFQAFGTRTLAPDFFLKGAGLELEAPEFFEAKNVEETLLFVSAKRSKNIEVWSFPFRGTESQIFPLDESPNGIVIDQERQILFATDSKHETVESFSLPELSPLPTFGEGILDSGEHNLDILTLPDGSKRLYVTDNNEVFGFSLSHHSHELTFAPDVESIEEILADSKHQILYVPEEQGSGSDVHAGGAILAFHPDGARYMKDDSNIFGQGKFSGDGEGITLYRCLDTAGTDSGRGFIISVDQVDGNENGYEFFDRETWKHLGTLHLEGVRQTDGIDVTERPLPGYPKGLFAAINSDESVALTSWERIVKTTGLACPN